MRVALLFILIFFCTASAVAQSNLSDSLALKSYCDCLESVYTVRTDFLKNISFSEERVKINPSFVDKYQLNWEEFTSLDSTKCAGFKKNNPETPCNYEEKLKEMSDDFELIIRVLKMNGAYYCTDG